MSMRTMALMLLVDLLAAGSVQAESPQGRVTPEEHARAQACKTEMQHLCAGKEGKAAKECLQGNESKLSLRCKEHVSK